MNDRKSARLMHGTLAESSRCAGRLWDRRGLCSAPVRGDAVFGVYLTKICATLPGKCLSRFHPTMPL